LNQGLDKETAALNGECFTQLQDSVIQEKSVDDEFLLENVCTQMLRDTDMLNTQFVTLESFVKPTSVVNAVQEEEIEYSAV